MKWVIEFEGGEAFPHNAAMACRIAAIRNPGEGEIFRRLEAALLEAALRSAHGEDDAP